MKRILVFLFLLATFASAQTDSTDILITVREDGDTLQTGRWRSGMPVRIRDSWDRWGERERLANKFVIVRVGVEKSRIDSFLVAHSDSTTGLRRKYQLSRSAIQFVKNNRDSQNVVRVTPAQLRNAFKRARFIRRFGEPQRMSILTPELFVRWRNMLIAPTLTSVTVITTGGGDYTSLVAAEAGEQDDLVTANEQITFNCSGTTADVAVVFTGWTTDATRLPIVEGDNTTGVWDATKYKIATNASNAMSVSIGYTVFANLQIYQNGAGNTGIKYNTGAIGSTIKGCLVQAQNSTGRYAVVSVSGLTLNVTSSIFFGWNIYADAGLSMTQGTNYVYNCILYNCARGIWSNFSNSTVKNCIAQNCTDGYNSVSGGFASNNISDLAGDAPGANSLNETTVNFADASAGDFRLLAGSPGIDQGADLISEGVTTDVRGVTRPQGSAFDIGAFEFVPVSDDAQPEKRNGFNGWLNKGFKGRY